MNPNPEIVDIDSTSFKRIAIAPSVLGRLLVKLGMPVPPGLLEELCRTVQPDSLEMMPGDRVVLPQSEMDFQTA